MPLVRAGLVLFIAVTVVSMAIGFGLFWVSGSFGAGQDVTDYLEPIFLLSEASFCVSVILILLAWRGRRAPTTDGVVAANVLVLGYSFIQFFESAAVSPRFVDSMVMFTWVNAGLYLACLVPAHLICCLVLLRTPLLRGLAPPPKNRGPAEASPA